VADADRLKLNVLEYANPSHATPKVLEYASPRPAAPLNRGWIFFWIALVCPFLSLMAISGREGFGHHRWLFVLFQTIALAASIRSAVMLRQNRNGFVLALTLFWINLPLFAAGVLAMVSI
jgi:hypothetical protein